MSFANKVECLKIETDSLTNEEVKAENIVENSQSKVDFLRMCFETTMYWYTGSYTDMYGNTVNQYNVTITRTCYSN